jgi:hypothetical protein
MPWKNGGGSTTQLVIEPPGGSLAAGFDYRLSMAAVPASGPFSSFPGIDRTLLLVAGAGMELDHGAQGRSLLAGPWQPVTFSGDWATVGRLLGGPCRDFNVMTARDRYRHRVTILRPGAEPTALPEAPVVLAYCARGRVRLGGGAGDLGAGRLLRLEGGGSSALAVTGSGGDTLLVVVALWPVA